MSDEFTHWWAHDARWTFCGLPTVGRTLSTAPTCLACQEQIHATQGYIAALEAKTPREYRIEAEAVRLAPVLYRHCVRVLGTSEPPDFMTLPTDLQSTWYERTEGLLDVLSTHPSVTNDMTLAEYVDTWKDTALRLVKGGHTT